MSKITFSIARGIAEHYCELTACCIGKWDDNYLLYRGVNITIVDLLVVFVVNRDVYIAEILVELNVNSIFVDAMAADNNDEVLEKLSQLEKKLDDLNRKREHE